MKIRFKCDHRKEMIFMDSQAREAREMTKQLPFKKRLVNFWFYNKWVVVGVIFVILTIAMTIYEITNVQSYDSVVAVYTGDAVPEDTAGKIQAELSEYCNDVNQDGDISVSVTPMSGSHSRLSEEAVAVETRLMGELNAGTNDIYIVDKEYYDFLMDNDYGDCFSNVYPLNENGALMEKMGLSGEYYLLVRDLYPADDGKADKRAAHNNAVAIYEHLAGIAHDDPVAE